MDAQMKAGESPVLLLRSRKESVEALIQRLPQFFFKLADCFAIKA